METRAASQRRCEQPVYTSVVSAGTERPADDNATRSLRQDLGTAMETLRACTDGCSGCPVPIARHTIDAIATGRVQIGTYADFTRDDFGELRRALADCSSVDVKPEEFRDLTDPKSRVRRAAEACFEYGFACGSRIYIGTRRAPWDLARTLVHEVNHVDNESDKRNDTPMRRMHEEYRAFFAERLLVPSRALRTGELAALKRQVGRYVSIPGVEPLVALSDIPDGVVPGLQQCLAAQRQR